MSISIQLGRDGSGDPVSIPLAKAPHILVAGMTGGGKSVFVHSIITDLLQYSSRDVTFVLIDPKRVEFGRYRGLPHLAWPYVPNETPDILLALQWAEAEMQMRFHLMDKAGARDISMMPSPWSRLVVVIDELANLMLAPGHKKMEQAIVAIASMGRAAGVHLVLATQRPSADVITGLIRANVPTRVCLPVITRIDSRIVLDEAGGEELVNPGDMLVRLPGRRDLVRLTGYHTTDQDIDNAIARAPA